MDDKTQAQDVPEPGTSAQPHKATPPAAPDVTTAFDPSTNAQDTSAGPVPANEPQTTEAGQPAPVSDKILPYLQPATQPGSLGRLGHFAVLEVLGRGGFGIVLKARDQKLHRLVAIKVLGPQLAGNATARSRFVREARAAAAVNSKHVVSIYAVDEQPIPYLVMEYVAGKTLQDRLDEGGPCAVRDILRIGAEIAEGLAAAHRQGLIHRDIKPSNILLESGARGPVSGVGKDADTVSLTPERVKITDFGLARAVDDASLTRTGVIAGTPMYMSPEQARGEAIDHRSDLFSLGSVLYTMATGQPPFRAHKTLGILKRVCDEAPRPIRDINPDIPDALAQIINLLLVKDPSGRLQTAAGLADVLRQHLAYLDDPSMASPGVPAAGEETVILVPPAGRESSPQRATGRGPRRNWLNLLGAASVLLVAIGCFLPVGLLLYYTQSINRSAPEVPAAKADDQPKPAPPVESVERAIEQADEWLAKRPPVPWTMLTPTEARSEGGAVLTLQPDGSLLATGVNPETDLYRIVARTDLAGISAIRLETLPDPALPKGGSGRGPDNGNFHLAEFQVEVVPEDAAKAMTVPIQGAWADHSTTAYPIAQAVDGRRDTHWEPFPNQNQPHMAIFELRQPVQRAGNDLVLRLSLDTGIDPKCVQHGLGRFRLSATSQPHPVQAEYLVEFAQGAKGWTRVAAVQALREDWPQALAALQKARADADGPTGYTQLLLALVHEQLGQKAEADQQLVQAMTWYVTRPSSPAFFYLGAEAAARRLREQPDNAALWLARARWQIRLEHHDEALADFARYHKLAPDGALLPDDARLLDGLGGTLLFVENKPDEAVPIYRALMQLEPKNPRGYFCLGQALTRQNKVEEAIGVYRQFLQSNPKMIQFHASLAAALLQQGRWDEAIASLNQADAVIPKNGYIQNQLAIARRFQAAEARLPAVQSNDYKPASNAERLVLIQACASKKLHGLAVRLYTEIFATDPQLVKSVQSPQRYAAACAAIRASADKDTELLTLSNAERASLRRQAFEWLQASLDLLEQQVARHDVEGTVLAGDHLPLWQANPDLAGLRDPAELGKLPEDERLRWQFLWARVQETLQDVGKLLVETRQAGGLTAKDKSKVHAVLLRAEQTYVFDMESQAFDTFLILQDRKGAKLAENDDITPENFNSRIIFMPRATGVFQLRATSYMQGGTGPYVLRIREFVGRP